MVVLVGGDGSVKVALRCLLERRGMVTLNVHNISESFQKLVCVCVCVCVAAMNVLLSIFEVRSSCLHVIGIVIVSCSVCECPHGGSVSISFLT